MPPEIVLVPGDLIYEMSSWTRAIIVPLTIVQAVGTHKPTPDMSPQPGVILLIARRFIAKFGAFSSRAGG